MTHYPRHTIAVSGNRSSRSFAFGFVVLLHICLILTVSRSLDLRDAMPQVFSPTTKIIEPEITPPKNPEWKSAPTKPVDPIVVSMPVLPIDTPSENGISQITPTRTVEPETVIAPTITPPRSDARRPLSQPPYPAAARRAGVEGTVELSLYVLANGRVGEAKVAQSSGSIELDDAAVKEALRTWRLLPQQIDGVAVAAWHNIAVTFRLKN